MAWVVSADALAVTMMVRAVERGGTHAQLAEYRRRSLGRVGILPKRTLNGRQSQTPGIALPAARADRARRHRAARYTLGRHVALAPNVRLRDAGNQVPATAKVANLH